MKLRTRLNLVVAGLTAAFVVVLVMAEVQNTRASVREEIEAANRVASQLLGQLAALHSSDGGPESLRQFLHRLGRVRANNIILQSATGEALYHSPPPTYKAGRAAPAWFAQLLTPQLAQRIFNLSDGSRLIVQAEASRAVLDAWDDMRRLLTVAVVMLILVNGLAFWIVERALRPFPIIVRGLERIEQGDLTFRLPPLRGSEAAAIGGAFNRMARAVEGKVQVERKVREAETRLEERRDLARALDQRLEEERRLIAHELHDEFGQSVTTIRSLAQAIAAQGGTRDPATADVARLISEEALRLYEAMHGLIPRLLPVSLDTLGLAETLEGLIKDWQRRYPQLTLTLEHELATELGPSITLAIYRVVQEGLINALRHAQASRVDIRLTCDSERLVVTISDDGVGLAADWSRPGHFGLRGLGERVENLGGTLEVANRSSCGMRLRVEVPLVGNI